MYEINKASLDQLTSLNWVDKEIPEDIREFAVSLIEGSVKHIDEIDKLIKKHSKNWKFERLSHVDKAILRISICQMLHMPDIPVIVAINEGIELGKVFGEENSSTFINGILDAVNREMVNNK